MEKLSFVQMENLQGGQTVQTAATPAFETDSSLFGWSGKDWACLGSALLFVAACSNPVTGSVAVAVIGVAGAGMSVIGTCW